MGLAIEYGKGQTPLDEEELEGLLIPSITTKRELNEHEELNIQNALTWLYSVGINKEKILDDLFIRQIHNKMYNQVWDWAGKYRTSGKNIGIEWTQIPTQLRNLLDDTKLWIKEEAFSPEETCIRFKHKLVSIHCFPNGNGRHSRILADILIEKIFDKKGFVWGNANLTSEGEMRAKYIAALKEADDNKYEALINFALGK